MREIKFRGKNRNGDFEYGSLHKFNGKYFIIPQEPSRDRVTGYSFTGFTLSLEGAKQVKKETIGEYIGKNDINKKEIYVGDIFEFDDGVIGIVKYKQDEACYVFDLKFGRSSKNYDKNMKEFEEYEELCHSHIHQMEIIGNIHEEMKNDQY